MGERGLGQLAEGVIQGDFSGLEGAKAVLRFWR